MSSSASQPLRIIFAGTPDFAAQQLSALLNTEHQVVAVYTQPDRPARRGKQLQASAVKQVAVEHGLPVEHPLNFKSADALEQLASYQADVMVVVAYGLLLPLAVLATPKHGCLNIHASLLPRWRGAAPIQRAIEAGDQTTGITIMQMNEGLDTGDMLAIGECAISADDTAASLHDKLSAMSPALLNKVLSQIQQGELQPQVQDDSQANYAHKLSKSEAQLNFSLAADTLALQVRAFNPVPTSFCLLANGERLKVQQACALNSTATHPAGTIINTSSDGIDVACGDGVLRLQQVQLPGKKSLPVSALINGLPASLISGEQLNAAANEDASS